jgi:hypothetical protein
VFQRSENCGAKSPKLVTVSLNVSNRESVDGPRSDWPLMIASAVVLLRP